MSNFNIKEIQKEKFYRLPKVFLQILNILNCPMMQK